MVDKLGQELFIEGNNRERRKELRKINKAYDDNPATASASGPTNGAATAADTTSADEIAELQTTIRCAKKNGLDVSLLEASLRALQRPAAAKPLTVGQAKQAAHTLEQRYRKHCGAVVAAKESLLRQEAELQELAVKFDEACVLRDVLIEQDFRATEAGKVPAEAPSSTLNVGKILAGEQIKLVYNDLFNFDVAHLDANDLAYIKNLEATTQAGLQTQFVTHFAAFQATMAAEAAKVQAEATARAAKRKRANEDTQNAADAEAANKDLPFPTATPPPPPVGSTTPPPPPKTETAALSPASDGSTAASSSGQAGGKQTPQAATPVTPKKLLPELDEEKLRAHELATNALFEAGFARAKKAKETDGAAARAVDGGAAPQAFDEDGLPSLDEEMH